MRSSNLVTALAALTLLALGSSRACAATFTVANLNNSGSGSLRQAILNANAAAGADTIQFQNGLTGQILLSANNGQLEITGDLAILGPGATNLSVSGGNVIRVFSVAAGRTVTISGLAVMEGMAAGENGGGILNAGTLTLNACTVVSCRGATGGGIYNTGTLTLTSGTYNSSTASRGGGIYNTGRVTATGAVFAGNAADQGGAFFNAGRLAVTTCTFSSNGIYFPAPSDTFEIREGGCLFNSGVGIATIADSTLRGNDAENGGAIVNDGDLTVDDCLIFNGVARLAAGILNRKQARMIGGHYFSLKANHGAGIANLGTATLTNVFINANGAGNADGTGSGGGIYNVGGITATAVLTLNGCDILGNGANIGGGIANSGVVTANNCQIRVNTANTRGGGIENSGTVTLTDCPFDDNIGGDSGGAISNSGLVTATRCSFTRSKATITGGGIYNHTGNLTLASCAFLENEARNSSGGAIYNHASDAGTDGTVTVTDSSFLYNRAPFGGGLYNGTGKSTLTRCAFSYNNAGTSGGGVANVIGAATLTDCTFSNNGARFGGGMQNAAMATVIRCRFSANSASASGGALSNVFGTMTAQECTLFSNFAAESGGGLDTLGGTMKVERCTITGNGAGDTGGGIITSADLTVLDCTLDANIATNGGGIYNRAILNPDSGSSSVTLTIGNCTLSGNKATQGGGGLLNRGQVFMTNCTFSGNRAEVSEKGGLGSGIRCERGGVAKIGNTILANSAAGGNGATDTDSFLISMGFNLDTDGTCNLTDPSDQRGSLSSPLDAKLGPLQNNGGPTQTHAIASNSPAIDRGHFSLTPATTDQRGFPRVADGDRNGSDIVDIGAFELSFFGSRGLVVRPDEALLAFSTIQAQNTSLPAGTTEFNLTIHYSADLDPQSFAARLNGSDVTDLFHPDNPEGFETVALPLRAGKNHLMLRVNGKQGRGRAEDVALLTFQVGEPPYGRR